MFQQKNSPLSVSLPQAVWQLMLFFMIVALPLIGYSQVTETPQQYLFEDTIKAQSEIIIELADEEESSDDSLQNKVVEALDSMDREYAEGFIPRVPYELYRDRTARIQGQMPLNINKRVAGFIDYFVVRNRNYTQTMLERQQVYFPLFEKYLRQYELPQELKYLSIVESGLNAGAVSHSGAVGLWQFMSLTGKDMNLNQDYYFDDRLDPEKATIAACKYLKMLYRVFGDWELVLAAYNCGLGKIKQTMRKTGKAHFWDMYDALPMETRAYVPQFVAVSYAMNYASQHNIFPDADSMLVVPQSDTILVNQCISLEKLAKHIDVPLRTLKLLNPRLRRAATPHNSPYILAIPADVKPFMAGNYAALMDSIAIPYETAQLAYLRQPGKKQRGSTKPTGSKQIHKVEKGETLFTIASSLNVSANELRAWNKIKGNKLKVGQRLTIYSGAEVSKNLAMQQAPVAKAIAPDAGTGKVYLVQPGDTLWAISQKYQGLTVADIIRLNGLKDRKITPGQKLIVG